MAQPLMPKATAVWLVDNTALTFDQISEYCGLHRLEVQAIADGEVAPGMQGLDPTANGQLTKEEIVRCEADTAAHLQMSKAKVPMPKARQKGARYTPISKRQDRPDAIAWLIRTHPELSDAQISRLIGTTKPTINAVRDKTHRNTPNISPQSPVYLGLCSASDLEKMVMTVRARSRTQPAMQTITTTPDLAPDKELHGEVPEAIPEPNDGNRGLPASTPENRSSSSWTDSPSSNYSNSTDSIPTPADVFGPKPGQKPKDS